MSLLGRLQDILGLGGEFSPFDDDPEYIDVQGVDPAYAQKGQGKRGVPPDNVIEMPGLSAFQSELVVMEPRVFEEIPEAIMALRERKTVILNLTHMDPDQAQRSVDYVAGGVFALDGHQERIGPNVFLFTPNSVQINNYSANPAGFPVAPSGFRGPFASSPPVSHTLSDRLERRPPSPQPGPPTEQF